MSGFAFVLVSANGVVVARTTADHVLEARRKLGCPVGHYVTSAASHAIGTPKPLGHTTCLSCGVRESVPGYDRCEPCRKLHRALMATGLRVGAEPPRNRAGSRRMALDGLCNRGDGRPRASQYAVCEQCLAERRAADNAKRAPTRAERRRDSVRGASTRGVGQSSSRKRGGAA